MMLPYKQYLISVHSVFPSVYTWVRQWGAWKLLPYNSNAKKICVLSQSLPQFGIWHTQNFVVMMTLVTITGTRTK